MSDELIKANERRIKAHTAAIEQLDRIVDRLADLLIESSGFAQKSRELNRQLESFDSHRGDCDARLGAIEAQLSDMRSERARVRAETALLQAQARAISQRIESGDA